MITKLFVPKQDFFNVSNAIKQTSTKHYPFRKLRDGYLIEFEEDPESPLAIFLALKYNIEKA